MQKITIKKHGKLNKITIEDKGKTNLSFYYNDLELRKFIEEVPETSNIIFK